MHAYQREFIEFAIAAGALNFGSFILKSGRPSPYFFNAGRFDSGAKLLKLGQFYAAALEQSGLDYDLLFGPAYKGIPLACATAIALARGGKDVGYAFNRKEAKDHGEGGHLVGAPLQGRVVIVDDVITAGTSIREAMDTITQAGATPCAVLLAFDRQEIGRDGRAAVWEIQQRYAVPVLAIVTLAEVLAYLEESGRFRAELDAIYRHRAQFGA
ncbi:orotate phosphoribosyltransferase [Methylothermus subterraneus]